MDSLLIEVAKGMSIFTLAWFSFWGAIPAGLALDIHPLMVIFITSCSYISGILLFILPSQSVRNWATRKFGKNINSSITEGTLIMRLWKRYGAIGFGFIAPMTVGAQLGTILGIALHVSRKQLILWMTVGVVVWSVGLTIASVLGISLITNL